MPDRKSAARNILTATILTLLLVGSFSTRANAFTNGESASIVIGQKDFTSAGSSPMGLSDPDTIAFDSTGNLWVEDANNRLLEFKPPFTTGMPASLVIGQSNLSLPSGWNRISFAFDSSGNLWVSDIGNNRVLEYKPPFANGGLSASIVIGQKNFTTVNAGGSKNGVWRPGNLAFDVTGNLWITDISNNRVLEYKSPFSDGMNASLVLGQPDFESSLPSTTQSGMAGPDALAFDSAGNLWVTDALSNNRVLEFRAPFSNGMKASLVIGQPDFVTNKASGGKTGLNIASPNGGHLTFDSTGDLWVTDDGNNRVLEFQPLFSNGMGASLVIGQKDFTTTDPATTQDGLNGDGHAAFDSSGNLWVADYNNNRVLEFSSTPVPEFPIASLAIVAMVSLAVVALVVTRRSIFRLDH